VFLFTHTLTPLHYYFIHPAYISNYNVDRNKNCMVLFIYYFRLTKAHSLKLAVKGMKMFTTPF